MFVSNSWPTYPWKWVTRSQCSLATIGVSVVVDVNQIKRARYFIQVVLCALYQKLCVTGFFFVVVFFKGIFFSRKINVPWHGKGI